MLIPRFFPDGTTGDANKQAPQVFGGAGNDTYKDRAEINAAGYWVGDYSMNNLQECEPTQIEVRHFYRGNKKHVDREDDLYHDKKKKRLKHYFQIGDNVIVTNGDMKNLLGKIKEININESERRVSIIPYTDDKSIKALKILDFSPDQLGKWFEAGNHVKVIEGQHKGCTGMICKVEVKKAMRSAIILQDETFLEVVAPLNWLELSDEKASGKEGVHGGYQVGQLVQITKGPTLACIIALEYGKNYKVITRENKIMNVTKNQIVDKARQNQQTTVRVRDQTGHFKQIGVGAMVKIRVGQHKDSVGEIKHLSMKSIWLRIHGRVQDAGYVVCLTDDVILDSLSVNAVRDGVTKDGMVDIASRRQLRSYEKRMGERVQIKYGAYKGMFGSIREEDEKVVKVLLDGKSKIIPVRKGEVVMLYNPKQTLANADVKKRINVPQYGVTPAFLDTNGGDSVFRDTAQSTPGTKNDDEEDVDGTAVHPTEGSQVGTRYGKKFMDAVPGSKTAQGTYSIFIQEFMFLHRFCC